MKISGYNKSMKSRDLSVVLKDFKTGWIAVNNKNKVVVTATSFASICKKVENIQEELTLLPAAEDYSGLVT